MRPEFRTTLALVFALGCCSLSVSPSSGQVPPENFTANSIRGTVVNSVTHEPVGRALVFSPDNRFATMTDSEGHFEFTLPAPSQGPSGDGVQPPDRPYALQARKPGFLESHDRPQKVPFGAASKELTISLTPEALIIGHVTFPTAAPSDTIDVELDRRQVQEGRSRWVSAGSVRTRSNGEFRFSDLAPGRYKLLTRELLDRDPLTFNPRGQLYGYPPVYFPNAIDFGAAAAIELSPGRTFVANLTLVRQPYYPVKVAVTNAPPGVGMSVTVSAQGHRGPGFALAYNNGNQMIEGMLPSGTYTLEAASYGPVGSTGLLSITVKSAPLEGPRMTLASNISIPVNIKEEFTSTEYSGDSTYSVGGRTLSVAGVRRYLNNVALEPADEFGYSSSAGLRNPAAVDDDALVIDNVQPGRYWVRVYTNRGFASSLTSGTVDLLRHPLVVLAGGSIPAIEIALRDDGAEVDGTVEGIAEMPVSPQGSIVIGLGSRSFDQSPHVYFLPLPDSSGEFRDGWVSPDGRFNVQQLPPGVYRVLAFGSPPPDLEYRSPETMHAYDDKGEVVRLAAGQKEHLRLQVIPASQ